MKTFAFTLFLATFAIAMFELSGVAHNVSQHKKWIACTDLALANHSIRLELLRYQVQNNMIGWVDFDKSMDFVDFLNDKAVDACVLEAK